ncbi:MAG: SH3 domain-containing protein [Mailhella sp.]|nr:SH3 domain-containing protein [Mailhella sp.]
MNRTLSIRHLLSILCLVACAMLSACAGGSGPYATQGPPSFPGWSVENAAGTVQDLELIPQDLAFFAAQAKDGPVRSRTAAQEDAERFRQRLFAPWHGVAADHAIREMKRILAWPHGRRGFAENLSPWADADWQELVDNARLDAAGGECRPAMTVHAADLRLAPTMRPRFARLEGAGQGYPFDDFQQTALHAGTPLAIIHASKDGAWLLAVSSLASGWIQAEHVAFAGDGFRERWEGGQLAAFLEDDVPLAAHGCYWGKASIGAVLPMDGEGAVLVPVRGRGGMAEAVPARLPAGAKICPLPLELTAQNIAAIGNRMLGQKYGWGGLYGDRDCSATMRDLFAPFGVWLPRNSAAQARSGSYAALRGDSAAERRQEILRMGIPFRTLICIKGHVGLYVGPYRGEPVFYHECWGVRRQLPDGRAGRLIIGRTVITSTSPGRERSDVPEQVQLIHKIHGVSVLGRDWDREPRL